MLEGVGLAFRQSRISAGLPLQSSASHVHTHMRFPASCRYHIRSGLELKLAGCINRLLALRAKPAGDIRMPALRLHTAHLLAHPFSM